MGDRDILHNVEKEGTQSELQPATGTNHVLTGQRLWSAFA
jgi:hypothetical protein